MEENLNLLEQALGHEFANRLILIEALSHPSLKHRNIRNIPNFDYERLELLGDSILNFVITEILFNLYKQDNEGKLAKIRSSLICKETLCKVATKINLASYIFMTYGEEEAGGRINQNNIENAMEAVIAAIYLDADMNVVKRVINNLWQEFLSNPNKASIDHKTILQELVQEKFDTKPIYEIVDKVGPVHAPIFTSKVIVNNFTAQGTGCSIKEAQKAAAKNLLANISTILSEQKN